MDKTGAVALGIALGVAFFSNPTAVTAHHSFAQFDASRTMMLEGTVMKFDWTNPHSWIYLSVAGPGGAMEEWLIELPAAAALAREGWTKTFVRPGEKIAVRINPLKDGGRAGLLQSFTPGE